MLSTRFGPELGNGNVVHEEPKSVAKDGLVHEVSKVVKDGLVNEESRVVMKDGLVHEVAKTLAKDGLVHGESKVLANVRLFQNGRSRWEVVPSGSSMVSCSVKR